MSQTYTYYKTTNFPNDLYPTQLLGEIEAAIATHVNSINIIDDNVDINFAAAISQPTLDSVIAAHVPSIVTYQTLYPENYLLEVNNTGTSYTYFGTNANEIHISKNTTEEYRTLGEAIAAHNDPNTIYLIHPGTYIENNPVVLPMGCTVKSVGTAANTVLVAQNPNSDLITLGINCRIFGMSLYGAYGSGARGVYFNASQSGGYGRFSVIGEVLIGNCDIAVEADGQNGPGIIDTLFCDKVIISASVRSQTCGIYCHSGAQFVSTTTYVAGVPGYFTVARAYHCDGAATKMSLITASAWFCTIGLYLNNNSLSEVSVLSLNDNVTGIQYGTTGTAKGAIASLTIKNSILYDLDIQATNTNVAIYNSSIDDGKINNPNNVNLNIRYSTTQNELTYQGMIGDVQVGSIVKPSELSIGDGKYNVYNLTILTNDNLEVGTWTDVTTNALSNSIGFNLFSATGSDNCLYIGSNANIYGIKIGVITATSSTTAIDDIVWEYWNGSSWVQFNMMQTQLNSPYYTVGNSFVSTQLDYNIRFGLTSSAGFVTKTLNGNTKKWIRLRVVNALSSIPVGQYLKIHGNVTKTNNDGFTEYLGNGRIVKNIPIEYITYASNSSPADQEIFIADNISIAKTKNKYSNGVSTRLGFCMKLPTNIDTSFPIKLNFAFVVDNIATGNIEWILKYDVTAANDGVYLNTTDAPTNSTNVTSTSKITTIPSNGNNKDIRETINIDVHKILPYPSNNPKYILWMSLERDSTISNTNDTYAGSPSIIIINPEYVSWNEGGHLLGF